MAVSSLAHVRPAGFSSASSRPSRSAFSTWHDTSIIAAGGGVRNGGVPFQLQIELRRQLIQNCRERLVFDRQREAAILKRAASRFLAGGSHRRGGCHGAGRAARQGGAQTLVVFDASRDRRTIPLPRRCRAVQFSDGGVELP